MTENEKNTKMKAEEQLIREEKARYQREWSARNRDKTRRYTREWRARNPEKVKEMNRRHWLKKAQERQQRERGN